MNSPTEQQLGAALRHLAAEQPFTPDASAIQQRVRRDRRRTRIARGGIGAGVIAVGAVAAVGVASAIPSAPAGRTQASGPRPATGVSAAHPVTRVGAAHPAKASPPTSVKRAASAQPATSVKSAPFAREIAAARDAATGDLDSDALTMAWPYATPVPGWLSAQLKDISAGGLQIDNYVWENSEDALIAGSADPQVRAGVLRLVSKLPGITVTHGTVDGQPALTLTAGQAELGTAGTDKADPKQPAGPAYQEAITINADTGIPLRITSGAGGQVTGTVSYAVTRVSLAGIAAGHF